MLRQWLIFLVAFVAGLAAFATIENHVSKSFQTCVSDDSHQHPTKGSQYQPKIIAEFMGSQTVCSIRLIDRHNGFFASLATLIIAAFTIALVNATSQQARLSQEVLNHTINADITTQRAYLSRRSIGSVEFKMLLTDDGMKIKSLEVEPTWENNGYTPAIGAKFLAFAPVVCVDGIPANYALSVLDIGYPRPRITIGSRQTLAGGSVIVPIEDMIKCSRRECQIFLIFGVEYNDVFPGTPLRITQYCEELRFVGFQPVTDLPQGVGAQWPFVLYGHSRFQAFT